MEYNDHTPELPLQDHIGAVFHYSGFTPDHSIERVVPTGHVFLIFELDGIARHTYDNETLMCTGTFTGAWIAGAHTGCISISAHRDSEMLVIRFKPAGAHPFLHEPVHEFNDRVIPAENVFGDGILELRERLLCAAAPRDKFALVDAWLAARFDAGRVPPPELLVMLDRLQNRPAANLKDAAWRYPHTHKHLIGQFRKYVGLTPKPYQRILRFNEVLQRINGKDEITWAEIASLCGYADQSHFIREFKYFSGFIPRAFTGREFHMGQTNFFPVDRAG